MNISLRKKHFWLLDMDGTIYLDDQLFTGTQQFLTEIRRRGDRYLFLTNNSSRGVESYVAKMQRLGVVAAPEDFLTSVDATITFLRFHWGEKAIQEKKIYLLGTASFRAQMEAAGFFLTEAPEDDVDLVLIGFDRELTYRKLEDACRLLRRKKAAHKAVGADETWQVEYIATNPDWVCPTAWGYVPDCGAMCQMLEHATGRKPRVIGKPQPEMVLMAMKRYGYTKEETVLIGDRLYTDIACGQRAGIDTIFVLSGEGTRADLRKSNVQPTYILENIQEIYNQLVGRA